MYLYFMSFLHIDFDTGTLTTSSCKRRTYIFSVVNIMAADVQAT